MTPNLDGLRTALDAGKLTGGDARFAADLLRTAARRSLTPKQSFWVGKLVERATNPAPAPEPEALTGRVATIFALFATAKAKGMKYPKIHLAAADGQPVVFAQAGERSKYTGQLQITDGGRFRSNVYFGRITTDGALVAAPGMTDAVRELVEAFAANPAEVAARYGYESGYCCFCSQALTTEESTAVGYGPVCADKFGLPWGKRVTRDVRPREFLTIVEPITGTTVATVPAKLTEQEAAKVLATAIFGEDAVAKMIEVEVEAEVEDASDDDADVLVAPAPLPPPPKMVPVWPPRAPARTSTPRPATPATIAF